MINFFKKKERIVIIIPTYIVFNVNNFNLWFNEPNNKAVYAHSGIFLRLDKLSEAHIHDYLDKCYGYDQNVIDGYSDVIRVFYDSVKANWKNRL
jgi:hypothetical protein